MAQTTWRQPHARLVIMKKATPYLLALFMLLGIQQWKSRDLISGSPPIKDRQTLTGIPAQQAITEGATWIYVWAEWCAICNAMQDNISAVLQNHPGLTIATRSGDNPTLNAYLNQHHLNWPTLNDDQGDLLQRFGLQGVPAIFYLAPNGEIVFSSLGYSSEWGIRFRLWLTTLFAQKGLSTPTKAP